MVNFDDVSKEKKKIKRVIQIGHKNGKTNWLFNLINHQLDIDKMCLYAKYLYKA